MKLIPLTQGKFAQVDDEDYDYLMQWKWQAIKYSNSYYAKRGIYSGKISFKKYGKMGSVTLHREIMRPIEGQIVDHKDGNGLNCQRANLRFCTISQNNMNKIKKNKPSKSTYKGVDFNRGMWRARIAINKNSKYLGYFKTEAEAAIRYNDEAKIIHGEFAKLNCIK